MEDLDFLDKPVATTTAPIPITTRTPVTADLLSRIESAIDDWSGREYQPSPWQSTNERRRSARVRDLSNLLTWGRERGYYTDKQLALVEKLLASAE